MGQAPNRGHLRLFWDLGAQSPLMGAGCCPQSSVLPQPQHKSYGEREFYGSEMVLRRAALPWVRGVIPMLKVGHGKGRQRCSVDPPLHPNCNRDRTENLRLKANIMEKPNPTSNHTNVSPPPSAWTTQPMSRATGSRKWGWGSTYRAAAAAEWHRPGCRACLDGAELSCTASGCSQLLQRALRGRFGVGRDPEAEEEPSWAASCSRGYG